MVSFGIQNERLKKLKSKFIFLKTFILTLNNMQLIILASGRGSRLKKLTERIPKCLIKVRSKTIIDYMSENFKKFNQTIILTGYKSALVNKKYPKLKKKLKTTNIYQLIWYTLILCKKLY